MRASCSMESCDRPRHAKGLCKNHYNGTHYRQARRCKTPDCSSYPRPGGLCQTCTRLKKVEIVPNDSFRKRYLELVELQGEQHLIAGVCYYMNEQGYRSYVKNSQGRWLAAEGHYLKRKLGLKAMAGTRKNGRVYPGGTTKTLEYEEAVALSRALGMMPIEAGV